MKEKFKGNLLLFGKIISNKAFYREFAPVHFEIADALMNKDISRLNIIVPRGIAKTTIAGHVYPLYHLFVEDRHKDRPKAVQIISKTQGHSVKCLSSIKNILEYSVNFRSLFGYHGQEVAKTWKEDEIILDTGDIISAKGMGNPIRGFNYDSVRPTLMICDDPEDENNTKTAEAMANNLDWVLGGALPALDTDIGRFLLIGTPLHQLCLVETFAKAPNWHTIRKKYLNQNPDGTYESLWPETLSVEDLLQEKEDLEAIGKVSKWYSERQCEIVGDEEQLFKPEYIQYYDGEYVYQNGLSYIKNGEKLIPVNTFVGVDPASSTKSSADFSVVFTIGIDNQDNVYAIDYFRRRVRPMDLAEAIMKNYRHYHPERVRIESIGYQEMLRDYLKAQAEVNGIYIPGLEIKEMPRNSKSARLESLQPRFAAKKVLIKKGMTEFEDELLLYPRGSHDDTLDAYFYAVKNIYKPYHTEVLQKQTYSSNFELDWKTL